MSGFFDSDDDLDTAAEEAEERSGAATWVPEEGEAVKGILTRADVQDGQYGPQIVLNVKVMEPEGVLVKDETVTVWCGGAVLKRAVPDAAPALGKGIKIRFEGMQPTKDGSNEYKMFTVVAQQQNQAFWDDLLARKPLEKRAQRRAAATNEPTPGAGNFFGT